MSEIMKSDANLPLWHNSENLTLIKNVLTKGLSDDEFKLYIAISISRGFNPLAKHIYGFKGSTGLIICAGIDGLRSLADETGLNMGTIGPVFEMASDGITPISATFTVKKLAANGHIIEFSHTCFLREFKNTNPNWTKMPCHMLGIRAESHAYKKAFPEKLSGIYNKDEIEDNEKNNITPPQPGSVTLDAKFDKEPVDKTQEEKTREVAALVLEGVKSSSQGINAVRVWWESLSDNEKQLIGKEKLKEIKKLCGDYIEPNISVNQQTGEIL